jgi:hypothetical protein
MLPVFKGVLRELSVNLGKLAESDQGGAMFVEVRRAYLAWNRD